MASTSSFQAGEQVYFKELAPGSIARAARAAAMIRGLSRRQHQVLELVAAGKMNKQIAYLLDLSEKTVKMHRRLLIEGLEVHTSAEAVRLFVEASFLMGDRDLRLTASSVEHA